jgi:hypothetical protein
MPQIQEGKMLWNQRSLRVVAVLVLIVALVGPVASAGAAGSGKADLSRGEISSVSWSRLDSLWSFVRSVLGIRPSPQSAACGGDRGAGLDPNGCGSSGTSGGGDPVPGGGTPSQP